MKQSGELQGFLLAGKVDILTREEQALVDERRKIQFDADEERQRLATCASSLLKDSKGIGTVFDNVV